MQFDDIQAVTISMEMERRGADFYRRASRVSKAAQVASLLDILAREEDAHQEEFARLADRVRRQPRGAYDEELSAYLTAIAAEIVFPGGVVELASEGGLRDPAAVLQYAIRSEKDSILFYSELSAHAADDAARSTFREILGMERRHLARLTSLLDGLGGR